MSRHIQLCGPCGQRMLETPMGTSEKSFLQRLGPKLCDKCKPQVKTMLSVLTLRERTEKRAEQAKRGPDLSSLRPDSSGWADVKRSR